jgi:hypothetical protein
MNLIQIQDKLKSLPNDPRVMQLLTSYANGQNPQVPPYLALGELNRRKGEMERAQMEKAGQPPTGTVKDQIEQQAGVMALQQGRQQQAMQNMMRQGMAAPTPVPQGIAQPQPQAQAMAAGGLASLRPGYRSGGVIAFREGDLVDPEDDDDDDEKLVDELKTTEKEAAPTALAGGPVDAEAELARLLRLREARSGAKPASMMSLADRRNMMAEKDPERYGILNTPIGRDAIQRLQDLQRAQRSEFATQREELAKSKPGVLQLLGQAAMGTRGQKGGSALASILGGYSELASGADAKQLQQEQALRMKELELQKVEAEARNKIDEIKQARADGDLAKEEKREMELAKLAKDYNISENSALGRQIAAISSIVAGDRKSKIAAKARVDAARLNKDKPDKPTDLGNMIQIQFDALVANGADPKDPNTRRIAADNATRALSKSAGTTRAETDAIDKANTAFENKVLMDRNLRKLRTTDPAAYETRLEEIRKEVETQYKVRPDAAAAPATGGAPAKPAAAPTSSPPVSLLKEGVETKFKNGQTWTLKNGKPVQVVK